MKWSTIDDSTVNITNFVIDTSSLMIPNPVWGAKYSLTLICPYDDLSLPCGNQSIDSSLEGCNPFLPSCDQQDQGTLGQVKTHREKVN